MKQIYLVLVFTLFLSSPVLAEGPVLSSPTNPVKPVLPNQQRVEKKVEERVETQTNNQAGLTEKLQQTKEERLTKRNENIKKYSQNLKNRLLAATERLKKIIMRLESRLAKLASFEVEVAQYQQELTNIKESLNQVELQIANVDQVVIDLLASEEPKTSFEKVRELIGNIKQSLIKVHLSLSELVTQLKGLGPVKTLSPTINPMP